MLASALKVDMKALQATTDRHTMTMPAFSLARRAYANFVAAQNNFSEAPHRQTCRAAGQELSGAVTRENKSAGPPGRNCPVP